MIKLTFRILFLVNYILVFSNISAQISTNVEELMRISEKEATDYQIKRAYAEEFAKENNIPVMYENDKGVFFELQKISEEGIPMYYKTDNRNSAKTISTDKVYSGGGSGLSLDGTGMVPREWDGGGVRLSHTEFGGRVVQGDNPTGTNWHATHVAGTIMAAGVSSSAKGMAYNANLRAFDWNSDNSEMASEAAAGAMVSNHSYGYARGWSWSGGGYTWYGTPSVSTQEDYKFGFYDSESKNWDQIAFNAPYYLIVKSAGNDRNEGPNGGQYPKDGPYDCIAHGGISKNVLTVGAVEDIQGGYNGPGSVNMSSFSSWGPADDGRVKPDIVANGVSLYSCDNSSNNAYTSSSGTSMSAPSATGSIVLLHQHWEDLKGTGEQMLAATVKGLLIHTADEAGPQDGPDYQFGWGLMNTKEAALRISEDETINVIDEVVLGESGIYEMVLTVDGTEDLKVTICWTDLPGQPVSPELDPIDAMLINDLDLRLTSNGNTYFPWKLNPLSPGSIATNNSENNVDNVEVVWIENPTPGDYTVAVDHDGVLEGGSQAFSIIISGVTNTISLPTVSAGPDVDVCDGVIDAQLNGTGNNIGSSLWRSFGDGVFNDPTLLDPVYTLGTSDIDNGSVILELTAYGIAPSTDSVSDIMSVNIVSSPISDAGDDFVICGEASAQLDGYAENYGSHTWITRGDGSFDDPSLLDAVYTPGSGDIEDGQVKVSLVVSPIAPCVDDAKDDMIISFATAPLSDAGDDGITCGNMPYQLEGIVQNNEGMEWSTSGDGTFDDITISNPVYTPGEDDMNIGNVVITLTAFPIAPCATPELDQLTLLIDPMPTINAGEDMSSCAGMPVSVTGSVEESTSHEWTTSGDGEFEDSNAVSTIYTPGTEDIVNNGATLTLTAYFIDGCEMGFDEVELGISPNAFANAGNSGSVCKDGSFTVDGYAENYTSLMWTSNGDGSFVDNTSLYTDYNPGNNDGAVGNVILTLSVYPEYPCSEVVVSDVSLEVLDCSSVGENSLTSIGFSLIPNPTSNYFTIKTDDIVSDNIVVKVISLDGKVVFSQDFNMKGDIFKATISASNYPDGIYTVVISSDMNYGVSRLMIKH